jgi:hypothetical protein
MRAVSIFALLAAAFGALIAIVTFQVMCFGEGGGSTMCPEGEPTTTMIGQLVLGILGFGSAIAMVLFAFRDDKRAAIAALVFALVLWAAWGLLNDAAVHEWGSEMRLIP